MVLIKCSKRGFLTGFDVDGNPIFGDKSNAILFDVSTAVGLCFDIDDPQNPTINTIPASK